MIYLPMTENEWSNLKERIETWLYTDLKDYNEGVSLLMKTIMEGTETRNFQNGEPDRYKEILQKTLKIVASLSNYPKIIDTPDQRDKPYKASVHVPPLGNQLPNSESSIFDRYANYDTYKDQLSPALQKEHESVEGWMLNRQSLHSQLKKLSGDEVSEETRQPVTQALKDQEDQIREYYDRVQEYLTGKASNPNDYFIVDPSTKPSGSFTKEQIDRMEDKVFAAECKMLRIETDKKYLRRQERNPEEVEVRKQELTEWGIEYKEKEDETVNPL